ncbi:hypothetical protein SAMN05428961_110136 [Paenibacillus sp. OK060]|uniref:hypothetical protein n=1 Tax=Paenibacillus sp. OK060 TaxID=1881034 RepID=UPI00088F9EC9|nr:hypothetical protein [Paenibacillus sp. OK060]SDM16688.1 hypothetical protein SAMN05428961_110136 [Paenibacillus sp. OK060]
MPTAGQYNSKFMDKSNWANIEHGWVFEAIVPYVGERPLDFFIPDKKTNFHGTTTGTRKVKPPRKGTSVATSEDLLVAGSLKLS